MTLRNAFADLALDQSVQDVLTQLDITLSDLRDALQGAPTGTLEAVRNELLDVATETTLAQRNGGGKSAATATVTSSGDTTIIAAPGAGNFIKLYWVSAICDPDETNTPLITVKASGGGEYYRVYALAHWEPFILPEDEALVVNLSSAASVAVTIHYEIV